MLAQAPALPPPEPSPEAVPGDVPNNLRGLPLPFAEAASEERPADLPPGLPFAIEADPAPEDVQQVETEAAPEEIPQVEAEATPETASEEAPPAEIATIPHPDPIRLDSGQALPRGRRGGNCLTLLPPVFINDEGSDLAAAPSVTADADAPPAEPDSTPESVPTAEVPPPVETSPVETAEASPHPDPLPEGEVAASTPDAPAEETAETAAKETLPVTTDPISRNPHPPTPESPPCPSRCVFPSLRAVSSDSTHRLLRFLWPIRTSRMYNLSHPACCSWSAGPLAGRRWLHLMPTANWLASGP